jgi:assimilatory nitrate reductase catalytic subunit
MGGREVGGLANQLAAHMGFDKDSLDRVGRFWDAPRMAVREGLKAVDLFHAIDAGKVKAVWIMGTNPAVSLPEADLVRRALAKCPVVVVSDCVGKTETQVFAHIRLPALAWGEKNGTVTNSERTISRLRPFMEPLAEARADWWAVARVGQELGWKDAFAWSGPGEVFKEYASLTAFENDGARDLDLGFALAADYDTLDPVQWGERRHFADGRFFTPDGKANLVPVSPRPMADAVDRFYPLRLNSGRYRDQWHTMTRTGLSARLSGHRPEPLVDMHPEDAAAALLKDGALARVESRFGTYVAKVRVTEDQRRGDVFVPMHWNDRFAAHAVSGRLFGRAVDPVSGQPASKAGAVRVAPYRVNWSGLLIARDAPRPDGVEWWVRHRAAAQGRQDSGDVIELAGTNDASRRILVDHLSSVFGEDRMEVVDPARKTARFAWLKGNRLIAALYLSPEPPEVLRGWLLGLLDEDALQSPVQRLSVLAGSAPGAAQDQGPVVCACFGVGLQTIKSAIIEQKLSNVEEIGAALKAGTGCGSCVPELKTLLSLNAPTAPMCAKAIA